MGDRIQTRGDCVYCDRELTANGLTRHLRSCAARRKLIEQADGDGETAQAMFHLKVQDSDGLGYWLHLEICGNAILDDLDHYLRRIWLDCCDHLSAFTIQGKRHRQLFVEPLYLEDDYAMDVSVGRVLGPGLTFSHKYDFGSTTELMIEVVDQRLGRPTTEHPVALMARNKYEPPQCGTCEKPAQFICLDCLYEGDEVSAGYICENDATRHEDHAERGGLMPIFNSPRTGVCGYSGPAEAPY